MKIEDEDLEDLFHAVLKTAVVKTIPSVDV
jgi:hypothetical protein